jgi:hypothetical protein
MPPGDLRRNGVLLSSNLRVVPGCPMSDQAGPPLEGLPAIAAESYRDLDLNRLAVYAIGVLREERIAVSFENLVVTLFRLFPEKFALRGYEYPDANRVNRALLQLGPRYRNWARGSTGTGFALTPLGEQALQEARERLRSPESASGRRLRSTAGYTWDATADLEELKATESYRRFHDGGTQALVNDDVWNALNAFSYTPEAAVRSRIITLRDYASRAGDAEVGTFLDALRDRFEAMVLPRRGGVRHA